MSVQSRAEMIGLLERHGVELRKSLGQHFLADPNITRKIVDISGVEPGDRVVEVGAGTGTLTAALADVGATVVAYEIDRRLAPILEESLHGAGNVAIRFNDIMRADLERELEGEGWLMVANLPYSVGTPLVLDVLRKVPKVRRLVVMIQKEVAERFVASPGSKTYGLPSVVCGLYAKATLAFRVPSQVFVPAPRVESAVVILERKESHRMAEAAIGLAEAGFGQRRKMLRRSLRQVMADPDLVLERAGIAATARPEELSADDFVRIAEVMDG